MRTLLCLLATLAVTGLAVATSASVSTAASYTSPLVRGQERVRQPHCKFWKTVKVDGHLERRCVSWGSF